MLKQLPTHFKAKREKGVGTQFPVFLLHYTLAHSATVNQSTESPHLAFLQESS